MEQECCKMENLRLPKLGQVGVVVKDLKKAVEYYTSTFGIGPFEIIENWSCKRAWINEKEVNPFKFKIAVADLGSVMLELMQVVEGETPHREFLETHGEGLQHLGFYTENYDEWKSYAKEKRMEIICEAEMEDKVRGKRRAFYMNSSKIGGVLFEILEAGKFA